MERLKGQNALITGATRGIGKSLALTLAKEGANVLAVALSTPADEIVQACQRLGVRASPCYGDVADFFAAEQMVQACVDEFGSIDILCNVAGIFNPKMVFEVSEQEWDRMIAVHLKGTFNLTRHAAPLMKQQKYGRIVNFISQVWVGAGADAPYSAAKGGIAALTYSTARDMGQYGVTCNAICPTAGTKDIDAMHAYMWPKVEKGLWTKEVYVAYMKELIAPVEHMIPIIAYLCSKSANNINGCIFGASASKISHWVPARETTTVIRDWEAHGGWTWEDVERHMPLLLKDHVSPSQDLL